MFNSFINMVVVKFNGNTSHNIVINDEESVTINFSYIISDREIRVICCEKNDNTFDFATWTLERTMIEELGRLTIGDPSIVSLNNKKYQSEFDPSISYEIDYDTFNHEGIIWKIYKDDIFVKEEFLKFDIFKKLYALITL